MNSRPPTGVDARPAVQLVDDAIAALRRTTGLEVRRTDDDLEAATTAEFRGAHGNVRYRTALLPKTGPPLRPSRGSRSTEPRILYVAKFVTPGMAELCRARGADFIDAAGNALIRQGGMFVLVTGRRGGRTRQGPRVGRGAATTPSALRITFVLLTQPELLHATHREIAAAAGVALGSLTPTFLDLEQRGFLRRGKGRKIKRLHYADLLRREWILHFPLRLKPKLRTMRYTADNDRWWLSLDPAKYGMLLGGEAAAERMTGRLRAGTCTLYIEPDGNGEELRRFVRDHRLRPDPEGNIEVLNRFFPVPENPAAPNCVPPLLAWADLASVGDSRTADAEAELEKLCVDANHANPA